MILMPEFMRVLSTHHFLSPDGKSFSFDHRANGYSRGEGIGAVLLKPLDDALRDGDTIRAVIRGSGSNQDGKTPGITLPSLEAQAALIRTVYKDAGLDYEQTSFFEAHGTGTAAGDPIELGALGATFGVKRNPGNPLHVGSLKANIGHLEGCAGLAGVMKAVLSLETGLIPPNVNFEKPNPKLKLDEWGIKIPLELTPWPTEGLRRASVNSFGYGGSNAHVILDDAFHYLKERGLHGNHNTIVSADDPSLTTPSIDSGVGTDESLTSLDDSDFFPPPKHQKLFVISSPEQSGLPRLEEAYLKFLEARQTKIEAGEIDEVVITDNLLYADSMAYTLSDRRTVFPWKTYAIASCTQDLSKSLHRGLPKAIRSGKASGICFVFTGQGAQWFAMGRELQTHEIFAHSLREAGEYFSSLGSSWSLVEEINRNEKATKVNQTEISQPICTALQVALVDLITYWGIVPKAVVGHSSGEIGMNSFHVLQ